MSIIDVTIDARDPVEFRTVDNIIKYKFVLLADSALIGSGDVTEELLLEIPERGKLIGISVACDSEDYDISVRTEEGISLPSVREVYQVSTINQTWAEYGLEILYSNEEVIPADALYFVLTNNDVGNDIETVELILYIEAM